MGKEGKVGQVGSLVKEGEEEEGLRWGRGE